MHANKGGIVRISHMHPIVFKLYLIGALVSLMLPTSVFAMGERPDDKVAALKKRCDDLSKETGEPHYYGDGKITLLVDYILPAGSDQNPIFRDFKGYATKITSSSIQFDDAYIIATKERFEKLPALLINQHYAFCYKVERNKRIIINYPKTMLLLSKE